LGQRGKFLGINWRLLIVIIISITILIFGTFLNYSLSKHIEVNYYDKPLVRDWNGSINLPLTSFIGIECLLLGSLLGFFEIFAKGEGKRNDQ